MTDEQYLEGWVRRGAWLVSGFVLLSLALGCGFVATRWLAGESQAALAGSAIMLSCCTVGLVAWAGLRLAKLVMMNTTALERLRYRLDLLEARADLAADDGVEVLPTHRGHDAAGPAAGVPTVRDIEAVTSAVENHGEPVIAARSNGSAGDPEIALCEAIERGDLAVCRELLERAAGRLSAGRLAQLQGQVDALAARRVQSLRESFRKMVHDGRFAEAIAIGERILREVPDRRIAADYAALRPLLDRRLDQAASKATPSSV